MTFGNDIIDQDLPAGDLSCVNVLGQNRPDRIDHLVEQGLGFGEPGKGMPWLVAVREAFGLGEQDVNT